MLVVDGVRLNNLIYRAGHLQNILSLDNNSLERVEVLFGPSSTMYGSDALGGVVHLYTKSPKFAHSNEKMNLKVELIGFPLLILQRYLKVIYPRIFRGLIISGWKFLSQQNSLIIILII